MTKDKISKAKKEIIKYVGKVFGKHNKKLYVDLFDKMTDREFIKYMEDVRDGVKTIYVFEPHGTVTTPVKKIFKIAKEIGYDYFQRLSITKDRGLDDYVTPKKYFVGMQNIRRTRQLASKGMSVSPDNRSRNQLTGQVTGKSKSTRFTMVETQMGVGMGLDKSLNEILTIRGGDLGAESALMAAIVRDGEVSQDTIAEYSDGVVSSKTLEAYWLASHINPEGLTKK